MADNKITRALQAVEKAQSGLAALLADAEKELQAAKKSGDHERRAKAMQDFADLRSALRRAEGRGDQHTVRIEEG